MANRYYVSLSKLSVFLDNLKKTFADISHTHVKNEIVDLQDIDAIEQSLSMKQDVANVVTSADTQLELKDNTEYRLKNISSLTMSYPNGNFESWMSISFSATGSINVVFPTTTKYIGAMPSFNNGQTWEINIKDGVAICWRVL